MIVTLQEFLQAVVDALSQITVQISTLSTFFVRTDATTVSLPEDTTLRVGRMIVYDDNGVTVDLFQRLENLDSIWTQSRYNSLKNKIDNIHQKLQKFTLTTLEGQPDRLKLDATLVAYNLTVEKDLGVIRNHCRGPLLWAR